jgi:predicted nucleic acid-binding protein
MVVLIDASILIESERGRLPLDQHLAQRQQEEFFLSVVTASALLHGVYRAVHPECGPSVPLLSKPSWSAFL